jgi:hypothetical protein
MRSGPIPLQRTSSAMEQSPIPLVYLTQCAHYDWLVTCGLLPDQLILRRL